MILFVGLTIVNAEVNFINPADMTYKNPLGSNPTYGTNCSVDGYSCVYLENSNASYSRFYTGNAGYNFPYTQLAVFNFSVVRRDSDQDTSIGSISLNGYSCYYNSTNDYTANQQATGDIALEPYKISVSAYCPLSGTFAINGRTKILEIRYTNQANISYVMLNRITFVSNGEVDRIIQLLGSSNSYWLTNNDLLNQINSKLGTIISNEQATTNAINNQTQQQQNNHDELMDEDIDATSKQEVDQTQYNNYKNKEQQLMGVTSGTSLNDLNIGIDANTSSTIWQLITRIIQQNSKIFGLFISILSIGIIKIALTR